MTCELCKRIQEIGMLCGPLTCACKCHAKSRQAIYMANYRAGFNTRSIAQRIKRGEGLL
ncbi:MAG: hypothetical protein QW652_06515 [Candidatus Nitrosotenuis sp.]